jgi:hypothetical protein
MPRHQVLATALFALFAASAAASPGDLVPNSTFDRDLFGWEEASSTISTFDDGAIEWSSDDAGGSAASGSMVVRDVGQETRPGAATTCVSPVEPDAGYTLDLTWKVPQAGGAPFVDFRFLMGSDCTGELAAGLKADLPAGAPGSWQTTRKIVYAPTTARSMRVSVGAGPVDGQGSSAALFDDLMLSFLGTDCESSDTMLCIGGRFLVEVEFETTQARGAAGLARAVPAAELGMPKGGLFWFFRRDNPEMLVKVLDGCDANGYWWVFYSAVTNVGFHTTVIDTLTGDTWTASNPDRNPAVPMQDTRAFPCT